MISQFDDFARAFDSITPVRPEGGHPSPFDDPFAYGGVNLGGADPLGALNAWEKNASDAEIAPAPEPAIATAAPGFYLVDDCSGRFAIEREFGIITLADETLATREHGAIWSVRVREVNTAYEAAEHTLRLKITGIVPQLAGAEDLGATVDALIAAPQGPRIGWSRYAAFASTHDAPQSIGAPDAAFGALIAQPAPAPADLKSAALVLPAPPAPASETAWTALALH